jgi:hypothetical protein
MKLHLVMKEDSNEYDSEEFDTAFFNKETAIGYIEKKQTEIQNILKSEGYDRYLMLSKVSDDRDLTKDEKKEMSSLDKEFQDFIEFDWYYREVDIEDSIQFFREKKLDYLMK